MDQLTMADDVVQRAYKKLWPEADRIRAAAYRCGGPRRPRRAADHLAFDLLNGGLREVWALADALRTNAESYVLELGCGLGGPARFIAERYGCRVVGLDVTSRQLAIARALGEGLNVDPQVRFVLGDARRLPFPPATYTHVYSIEAFVHVSDKPTALREAFRVLRPGGVLCIQDPVHDPELQITLLEETLHPLSLEQYKTVLSEVGFCEVVASDRTKQSEEEYTLLSQLLSSGPIYPWKARSVFEELHPGISPPLWRFISPWRIRHALRYMSDRYEAALDLLGDEGRVAGVRRMCEEIVNGYLNGTIKLYQLRALKPGR